MGIRPTLVMKAIIALIAIGTTLPCSAGEKEQVELMRHQGARKQRVLAVDKTLDAKRKLAVLGDEPLHAVGESAIFRIEVFLELVFELVVDGRFVLIERLLEADDELVAFAAEDVGRHLPADMAATRSPRSKSASTTN